MCKGVYSQTKGAAICVRVNNASLPQQSDGIAALPPTPDGRLSMGKVLRGAGIATPAIISVDPNSYASVDGVLHSRIGMTNGMKACNVDSFGSSISTVRYGDTSNPDDKNTAFVVAQNNIGMSDCSSGALFVIPEPFNASSKSRVITYGDPDNIFLSGAGIGFRSVNIGDVD